jgi:tetratricopeptide (TPR) repeat protein
MEIVERYQILLEKDPRSQVFAPLAEAYRKIGLTEEAFRICVRGVQYNPNFAGGRIALANVLLDRENPLGAQKELERAIEISPDNIMAHQLLAELYLKQKKAKEALRAYKMVLFLAPTNDRAQKAVRKLEALTADEFDEDLFAMRPLKGAVDFEEAETIEPLPGQRSGSEKIGELDRYLSLADAYFVRNDYERAGETLHQAEKYYSTAPELTKRLRLLNHRLQAEAPANTKPAPGAPPPVTRQRENVDRKIEILSELLHRFQTHSR